jgi:hypothetical protein
MIGTEERTGLATLRPRQNNGASLPAGLFENKSFFQMGFVFLGLSGLARTAERLLLYGLHWNQLRLSGSAWMYLALVNLVTVAFAIVFLRYLSKGYNRTWVWISLTCTAVGWVGFLVFDIFGVVPHVVPPVARSVAEWFDILGNTGSPLSCFLGPFMAGSQHAYRWYLIYVVNADFAIKLLFFGLCVWRYSAAQRAEARVPQWLRFAVIPGAATVIYGLVVQSFPRLFSLSLDGSVDQGGNQNIAILANLLLLGVIGVLAGVGTLIYYVTRKTKAA